MSDEDIDAGGTETPLSEQVETVEAEDQVSGEEQGGTEQDDEAALEAEAREMGWVPESEWKGDKKPRKFVSAKEFIERGETILPIALKRAKDAETKLAETDKKWEERFKRMERMNEITLQKQREKIEAEYEARMDRAVEMGDTEAYKAAKKEQKEALKDLDDTAKEPEAEKTQDGALKPHEQAAFVEWKDENAWFGADKKLTVLMDAEFAEVSDEMPGATFAQKLAEARTRVAAIYPEKFGEKPSGKRAGAVESGSRMPGGGGKARLADKLPDEAKKAADKFIADGLFKDREEYAKEYFGNEAA